MPRRPICRMVDWMPEYSGFLPEGVSPAGGAVTLLVDEFEAVRLADYEGLTHEECAARLGVSRPTATEIIGSARKKIADALVNGRPLRIEGGRVRVRGCCALEHVRGIRERFPLPEEKGVHIMRIAVPSENGEVFQHFGRAPGFTVYTVEEGRVLSIDQVQALGTGHGAMASLLREVGANLVICGGIGTGAVMALQSLGVDLIAGASGSTDDVIRAYLGGTLVDNPDVIHECGCGGHGHEEGEGCGCGGHHHEEGGCGCHGGKEEGGCCCGK
ncbi:MAG: DUF134 domain-containing protein [Sutterellaceae bacterium]|nr:DUF134 domain-containing protein [Sutterellaceae bacterium]MDY2868822.1 DUF134 domain-containing protein [Mesosutterella sp.]